MKYTLLIKNEVNDHISCRVCSDWLNLIEILKNLSPGLRPAVKAEDAEEDDEDIKPEKLRIVILEGEEVTHRPDTLDIFVKASYEEEF